MKKQWTKTGFITIYSIPPGLNNSRYGKTSEAFRRLQGKRGTYKLYEGKKLVYVGSSNSDLYKTILRKFQEWNDGNRGRLHYDASEKNYRVKAVIMPYASLNQILDAEYHFIQKLKPRDNSPSNYSFYNRKDLYKPEELEERIKQAPTMSEKQIEKIDYSEIPF